MSVKDQTGEITHLSFGITTAKMSLNTGTLIELFFRNFYQKLPVNNQKAVESGYTKPDTRAGGKTLSDHLQLV